MAVKDKNTLKAYFENGDIPTQEQFEDLIDSLKHQDEASGSLSKPDLVLLNNRIISENGYIFYSASIGNAKAQLEVDQQNAPAQMIEIRNRGNNPVKQYFLGDAPYTLTLKEFQGENLGTNEYYFFNWATSSNYNIQRLSGNNLPDMPQGLELGVLDKKRFNLWISKQNMGQKINIVHTSILFYNDTGTAIEYKAASNYWSDRYRTEDSTTDHYDAWDSLSFFFNAKMKNASQSIVCNIYDKSNGQLLETVRFETGQNYQDAWGGQVNGVRNVLIECTKQ